MSKFQSLADLQMELREFAVARDWEKFHTPKNLAMALTVEAAELLEQFQWLTPEESQNLEAGRRANVESELADIQIYLARLADLLDVELLEACSRKIEKNENKYPAEKVRGSAKKYTEYSNE